jgi:hypothetical protein
MAFKDLGDVHDLQPREVNFQWISSVDMLSTTSQLGSGVS